MFQRFINSHRGMPTRVRVTHFIHTNTFPLIITRQTSRKTFTSYRSERHNGVWNLILASVRFYILPGQENQSSQSTIRIIRLSTRYLGVDLSTNISSNTHINRITSNANKSLGFIKRNIKIKHKVVCEVAYQTIVHLQLEYGSTVWSPYSQT